MAEMLLLDFPAPGVALVTLNRPEVMNAIDMDLAAKLYAMLDGLEADDAARVIILTGAGERAFCAGFDIHEMTSMDGAEMVAAFARRDPITWRVARHSKPIIAALNGVAYGAGALIAAAADIRVGCPATRFKVTATGYGGANATWTLPLIVGMAKAKEILMTGRVVSAQEALAIGLVNQLAEEGGAVQAAIAMAVMIAANPPSGVQGVKELINGGVGRALGDAYRAEFAWMTASTANAALSGAEVFEGFLEGRPARG